MIEVRMTLVSAQDASRTDLGLATISLIETAGGGHRGQYRIRIMKGGKYSRNAGDTWKIGDIDLGAALEHRIGIVDRWPRTSKKAGPWELLLAALDGLLRDRVPDGVEASVDHEYDAGLRMMIGELLMAAGLEHPNDAPDSVAEGLSKLTDAFAQVMDFDSDKLMARAASKHGLRIIEPDVLRSITKELWDHPEGWEGPCGCMACAAEGAGS